MIRFRDDQVYNQIARWVAQRRFHTINRYFSAYPEQKELPGMQDLLTDLRANDALAEAEQGGPEEVAREMWDQGKRWLATAGKVALGVGGLFLVWGVARRIRRKV